MAVRHDGYSLRRVWGSVLLRQTIISTSARTALRAPLPLASDSLVLFFQTAGKRLSFLTPVLTGHVPWWSGSAPSWQPVVILTQSIQVTQGCGTYPTASRHPGPLLPPLLGLLTWVWPTEAESFIHLGKRFLSGALLRFVPEFKLTTSNPKLHQATSLLWMKLKSFET